MRLRGACMSVIIFYWRWSYLQISFKEVACFVNFIIYRHWASKMWFMAIFSTKKSHKKVLKICFIFWPPKCCMGTWTFLYIINNWNWQLCHMSYFNYFDWSECVIFWDIRDFLRQSWFVWKCIFCQKESHLRQFGSPRRYVINVVIPF